MEGAAFLACAKQVAHAGGAHADEHLHEVRTGDGEKRHARFAGNGLGQQRLARTRRADEQHALGDARADVGELGGVFQELHDLAQLFLFLIRAGDILKGDVVGLGVGQARAALAEAGHALAAAGLRTHDKDVEHHHDADEDERGQEFEPPRRARGQLRGDIEAVFGRADLAAKYLRVDGVDVRVELLFAGDGAGDVIAGAEFAFGDLAVLRAGDERRLRDDDVGNRLALLLAGQFHALVLLQVGLDPLQQRGIAQLQRLRAGGRAEQLDHPEDDQQEHDI